MSEKCRPVCNVLTMESPIITLSAEDAIPDGLEGRWWVAHTRPRNEKALASDLRDVGVYCYLPLQERRTRSSRTRRISRSEIPVFPSYLFFNATEEQRHRALKTRRVANLLAVRRQDELVRQLRQIHQALLGGVSLRWHPELKIGDWARVVDGPLMGVEGVVVRRMSRVRLVLNVTMLGQSVSVEVSDAAIERMAPPSLSS